ncbi:uncharacterized protein (TIGR02453 family) [Neolewinella xylanilytica]|uniref:Uncharacterized protein (TIGR02453 family) n=1 Tax=Neolewinella xylanilytica TaxID=1514080 RepID=A0A2S6I346_9BACT|nr:DUF2461 domain-containing protein [Neolewinella xylanilytica]PPK85597.1 uncharacterized protein (TIGR02453 family) [Neolewinella xylanilytica]
MKVQRSTYDFLRDLAANNDRDWFTDHKPRYEAARANVSDFAEALLERLRKTDVISTESGRKSLFRIYRDVRFSKNKLPYKTNIAGSFERDGLLRRGGYYFSLSPERNMVGGGFYGIERDDLNRIRQELAADAGALRAILADKEFGRQFSALRGEQLKTAPQGYPRDHPDIDLLRYKQFYAAREFSEAEVLDPGFIDRAEDVLLALRPFFDYFSEVLTTDANGERLV